MKKSLREHNRNNGTGTVSKQTNHHAVHGGHGGRIGREERDRVSDIDSVEVTVHHESDDGGRANCQLGETVATSRSGSATSAMREDPTQRVVRRVGSLP